MGFRPMRRGKQELDREECIGILKRGTSGVLALDGDEGYPYAVPMSYAYDAGGIDAADAPLPDGEPVCGLGRIVFHSALDGHKIDAIRRDPKASFCVIGQDDVVPEKYTTLYRSVIAFGRIRILEDDAEKRAAAELLGRRYWPEAAPEREADEIGRFWSSLCMFELRIEHLVGKEARELAKGRTSSC